MSYIQQLADYIKKNLKKGYTLESLKVSLQNQGYSRISVENAANLVNKQLADIAPPMIEKPEITYKVFEEDLDQENEEMDKEEIQRPEFDQEEFQEKKGFLKRLFKRSS